jgi:hypothetical protein
MRRLAAGTLALSLDWNDRIAPSTAPSAAVSLSDGSLCIVDLRPDGGMQVCRQWQAHDLEAWITAWDCHKPWVLPSARPKMMIHGSASPCCFDSFLAHISVGSFTVVQMMAC